MMNNFTAILQKLIHNHDLTADEMSAAMRCLMTGQMSEAQIGALLTGLTMKGESVEELTAATLVMRNLATKLPTNADHLVDIVGTGGDKKNTFNISTATSFVVAAAGGAVAKHGNRSVSSKSGSADVLETAGMPLDLTPEQVAECIKSLNIGFMFAPAHHQAMKHAINARRALGVRTIFNLLGPLTNPAQAQYHLIGVYDKKWLLPFAQVLQNLGSERAMIVHSADGLDEISITHETFVVELSHREIREYTINPKEFNLSHPNIEALVVDNAQQSLALINSVFDNTPGPARDIVSLNAGAALYITNVADTLKDGIHLAQTALANGAVKKCFHDFIQLSQSKKGE